MNKAKNRLLFFVSVIFSVVPGLKNENEETAVTLMRSLRKHR